MGSSSKWHKGVSKLMSSPSKSISEEQGGVEEDDDAFEVEAYFQRLKSKTNMKQMWSSKTFDEIVDGDVTPEVSSESDQDLDMNMSRTLKNLQDVRMDSDEDEMRKDFAVEQSVDENNNDNEGRDSDEEDGPLNMMNNIRFAELDLDVPELLPSDDDHDSKDFLPKIGSPRLDSDEDSRPIQKLKYFNEDDEPKTVSELRSSRELSVVPTDVYDDDDDGVEGVPSELSVETVPSNSKTISSASKRTASSHDSYSKSKSHVGSSRSDSRSRSKKLSKHSSRSRSKSMRSSSLKSDRTVSELDESLSESSRSRSATDISNKTVSNHSTSASGQSRSKASDTETSRGKHRHSNRIKSTNKTSVKDHKESGRTSQKAGKSSHETSGRSGKSRQPRDTGTQTSHRLDPTLDVMGFQYDWQTRGRSNVAAHVIDPTTVDVLTSYNPSVLAANDLMKFHMQLLQQHIEDSRRLYESYANENVNSNYRYTTVEDTQKYIQKNKPKVISYEEALEKVKDSND